jgi:hypothetical protein
MQKMAEAGPMHKGTPFALHPREQGRKVKGIKAYGFGLAARASAMSCDSQWTTGCA